MLNACRHLLLYGVFSGSFFAIGFPCASASTSSYHIGNSLTYDSQPLSLSAFATMDGREHSVGYDIRPGESLPEIVAASSTSGDAAIYLPEYGQFGEALANHAWSAVTMQPHISGGSTLGADVSSILTLIDLTRSNPLNAGTAFYIYSPWPQLGGFPNAWNAPIADLPGTPTAHARDYYDHLINRVRASTDAQVFMIPVGEVLNAIDGKLRAGAVPGYSSVNSFYRDGLHMNDPLGRYAAAVTTYATLFNRNPEDLTRPPGFFQGNPFEAELIYSLINQTARDVIEQHPFSGIDAFPRPPAADVNQDGIVDIGDLSVWTTSMGKSNVADATLDGVVDEADRLAWQARFGQVIRKTENFDPTDVDQSGLVDGDDLNVWLTSYGEPDGPFDVNGDGLTDGADFLQWQRTTDLEFFLEDFNQDELVDDADLDIWTANAGFDMQADVNNDDLVDGADFLYWQREVGLIWPRDTVLASNVPEASGVLLILLGIVGCRRVRPILASA